MGKSVVVTASFTVVWDTDDLREQWDVEMSDAELAEECLLSVDQDWSTYALTPDTIHLEADVIG